MHTLSNGLRKLTKRVTDSSHKPRFKSPAPVMAEQEEDFSSLPLPDRFQHKVSNVDSACWARGDSDLSSNGKFEKPRTKMQPSSSR